MDSQQIDALLKEQKQAGLRIGALAVLRGWLSQETLDWFLRSLAPEESTSSAFIKRKQPNGGDRTSQAAQPHSAPEVARAQPRLPKPTPGLPTEALTEPKADDIFWVD
ncbi:hypothetical protein [Nodosilinea sp. E11]|uniref:hypothetical protein n=1 Tax=Nodosilinea sp. E11 TaxID=3037479 RepID=UPI0029349252|nr:hypothetical protein [Nodosilinea sp. E11]WOD40327.1 hypothetical protein RRF56_05915 [Nodosilinea sp. E11]